MRRTASEVIRNLERRVARLERRASSGAQGVANEIIQSITASNTTFKVENRVKCEIAGSMDHSLVMYIKVVQSVDLPESAKTLSVAQRDRLLELVQGHLKNLGKSQDTHLLSRSATINVSLRAESLFNEDNKWTRKLKENSSVQLGHAGQLVAESTDSFNSLKGVKLLEDKIEWYVTSIHQWNCVQKRR